MVHVAFKDEVWLLDDDAAVLDCCRTMLEDAGFLAQTFTRADALLGAAPDANPHCILVDWLLPRPDGLRVAARCKLRWPNTPVLLTSGYASVALTVEAMKQGLAAVLEKPFLSCDFIREVRNAIDASRQRTQQDPSNAERANCRLRQLTQRERLVLELIAEGRTNKTIAHQLHLGLRTVEKCRASLFAHLEVDSVGAAVRVLTRAEPYAQVDADQSPLP